MRTLPPETPHQEPPHGGPTKRELIFRWVIPLPFFGGIYFLGFLMGRELTNNSLTSLQSIGGRIASLAFLSLILIIFISGLFFILYLIKSLMGINLFSTFHLME